jgi:superfamily I DNA/RNA helicase
LYTDILEYFKRRSSLTAYIKEAGQQEKLSPDVLRFLEMIKGRERETVEIIKMALDTERALERLEKLRLFVDTVHAAKGLEADVVFVANFTKTEKPAGNRRLTYVALTRAREKVYIVEDEAGSRWLVDL